MYVDDVIFAAKNPMRYIRIMAYEFQLKGVDVPEYYLGSNMELGKDGEMSWSAKSYINNVSDKIDELFETCHKSWDSSMAAKLPP